jgi:hypothetical protein
MSGKALRFHQAAEEEIEQAFEWYRERSEAAAANFLREVTQVVEKITEAPPPLAFLPLGNAKVFTPAFSLYGHLL